MGAALRPLRGLSLTAVAAGFATVVLGGYVSQIGAGLACPDWPTCHGQLLPSFADPGVAAEWAHRLAALLTGLLVLGTLVTAWAFHRDRPRLVGTVTTAFGLLAVQVTLGMLTITTALEPLVVTAHLGVATAFLLTMAGAAFLAFREPPSQGAGVGRERKAKTA